MAEFAYKGRSATGGLITGKLYGTSADAVAGRLVSTGITPIEVRDLGSNGSMTVSDLFLRLGGGQPTTKDLVLFCRQMHTITRTGLPLLKGLTGLMQTTHNEVLRAALVDVEPRGTRRLYQIKREGLEALREYVESFWDDVLSA